MYSMESNNSKPTGPVKVIFINPARLIWNLGEKLLSNNQEKFVKSRRYTINRISKKNELIIGEEM